MGTRGEGNELVDSPSSVQEDLAAVAETLARGDGVSWAYDLLDEMSTRHRLSEAWLVVDPGSGGVQDATPQVFGLGGRPASVDTIRSLLERPAGVYGEPFGVDVATNKVVGPLCRAALRASVASLGSALDPESGLSSRAVVEGAIARAVACGARYGWSSTLVVLTTGGDAAPEDRWLALAEALGQALRSGDEAGVTTPGVALALLGNAGPDAVRPFIGRVRAALSAAGWEGVDLHAATARTPEETVDPAELKRLAAERLSDAGVVVTPVPSSLSSRLELELRLLPGVVHVAMETPVVVVSTTSSESLHDRALRLIRTHLPHASMRLLTVSTEHVERAAPAPAAKVHDRLGHEHTNGNGHNTVRAEEGGPFAISASGPGGNPTSLGESTRVSLLSAAFDAQRGVSEVALALGPARGTGRAPAGPLAGGAQATLNALSALALDIPFYLVSAERAHGVPGEPVVVVLAPKRTGTAAVAGAVERLGVATGAEDIEAASRATLGALNRHLTRSTVAQ